MQESNISREREWWDDFSLHELTDICIHQKITTCSEVPKPNSNHISLWNEDKIQSTISLLGNEESTWCMIMLIIFAHTILYIIFQQSMKEIVSISDMQWKH